MESMISVVIPAFNEEKSIGACLKSLTRQTTKQDFEVIVVNNASTDRTAEVVENFAGRLTIRLISEKKKGRGQARATGCASAHGEILLSTDADTQVPANWIEVMTSPFSDPQVVATVSLAHITDAGTLNNWLYRVADVLYMWGYRFFTGYHSGVGFSMAMRKTAYTECGGFDAELKAQEDLDLGARLRKQGKIILLSQMSVHVSGRRFAHGVLRGGLPYLKTTVQLFFLRKKTIDLHDVR